MQMRKGLSGFVLATILCCPLLASAKSRLLSSEPVNGASLADAPQAVRLVFDKKTKLTALLLQLPDGTVQALTLPATQLMKKQYDLRMPGLKPGRYLLRWTGRGKDHWYGTGTIRFSIQAMAS